MYVGSRPDDLFGCPLSFSKSYDGPRPVSVETVDFGHRNSQTHHTSVTVTLRAN
jgi:hypothetical protein